MSNTDTSKDHTEFRADMTYLHWLAATILEDASASRLAIRKPGPAIEPPNGLPHGNWPRDAAGPMILRWQRETRQDCGLGQ